MTKIPLREDADSGNATSSRTAPTNESHARHSPLPFLVTDRNGTDDMAVCGIDCADGWTIADLWADVEELRGGVAEANAAFIVRACNSHDALLAALKAVVDMSRFDCGRHMEVLTDEWQDVIARIYAAIAKAEGR